MSESGFAGFYGLTGLWESCRGWMYAGVGRVFVRDYDRLREFGVEFGVGLVRHGWWGQEGAFFCVGWKARVSATRQVAVSAAGGQSRGLPVRVQCGGTRRWCRGVGGEGQAQGPPLPLGSGNCGGGAGGGGRAGTRPAPTVRVW